MSAIIVPVLEKAVFVFFFYKHIHYNSITKCQLWIIFSVDNHLWDIKSIFSADNHLRDIKSIFSADNHLRDIKSIFSADNQSS